MPSCSRMAAWAGVISVRWGFKPGPWYGNCVVPLLSTGTGRRILEIGGLGLGRTWWAGFRVRAGVCGGLCWLPGCAWWPGQRRWERSTLLACGLRRQLESLRRWGRWRLRGWSKR